jgi:mono/diheme cytochrome c family protein
MHSVGRLAFFAAVVSSALFATLECANAQTAKQTFIDNCAACHGEDARGVKDQGADLIASALVKGSSDATLMEFLKMGRQPDAPDSTMKLLMPAFDYLTDEDLAEVIAYVRHAK